MAPLLAEVIRAVYLNQSVSPCYNLIAPEVQAKKKEEDQKALERSKLSKTGAEWKLEEDHCLSQAVKKYPVFLHFVG